MDWDSLRQGASFGILSGLVQLAAGVVVIVFVVRAALRWLRFPDRFIDDEPGDLSPSDDEDVIREPDASTTRARDDRTDADREDEQ